MKKTLLQKALDKPRSKRESEKMGKEQIELALAWAKGEIAYLQVQESLKGKATGGSDIYSFLARALKAHIQYLKPLKEKK